MRKTIIFTIILLICLVLYAFYIEPSIVTIKKYTYTNVVLPEGFNGFKIAHFSDLLYKNERDLKNLEKAVEKINELNPDIIVFTGDLLNSEINEETRNSIISLLQSLNAKQYKYAIKGDKDPYDISSLYEESGFIYLDNEASYIFNNDVEPILIVGGDFISSESYKLEDELNYNFAIILSHEPDLFNTLNLNAYSNLVLSGHSLGGQIRLPFWGAVIKKKGASNYTDRYYQENDNTMYVSYGLGTEKGKMRFLDTPEISLYTLYNH